jgi:hypothetical protein
LNLSNSGGARNFFYFSACIKRFFPIAESTGFSTCRAECFRPGCCAHSTVTVRPIFRPAQPAVPAAASAPSLTSGLGLPGFEFRGGVPVPVGHGAAGSRQSTRWLGPWVTPSVGPRGRRPRHQTLLGYGGPRRRILSKSHRGIEIFAPICACPWRRTPGGAHSDLPLRGSFQ